MAWTNVGFDGTINEAQWSQMAGLLGNGYVAAGNGDCVVTAVPGARSVSVAAGSLYGDGVVSTNSGPETVAMTTPVNGQWYVIALRRTWATNTAALVAIAGATTTTTTPTAPPTSFPTLNTNVGVLTDQPIAWAWCNSANTTVVVYDIRLKAVKSLPPVVANGTERDAKFMSPTQGLQVWRDDLGTVETYYGLYNASTNPGGRDAAGWYVNDRQTGLIPIAPVSVVAVTGTATANSLGRVTFNGITSLSFNGVFSSKYKNYLFTYVHASSTAASGSLLLRIRNSGTDYTTNNYSFGGGWRDSTGASGNYSGSAQTFYEWGFAPTDPTSGSAATVELYNPNLAASTMLSAKWQGWQGASTRLLTTGGAFFASNVADGFTIYVPSGTVSGTIQVYGIND